MVSVAHGRELWKELELLLLQAVAGGHSAKTGTCSCWKSGHTQTNRELSLRTLCFPQTSVWVLSNLFHRVTTCLWYAYGSSTSTARLQLLHPPTFSASTLSSWPPAAALIAVVQSRGWLPDCTARRSLGQPICGILLHPRSGPSSQGCYLQTYHRSQEALMHSRQGY